MPPQRPVNLVSSQCWPGQQGTAVQYRGHFKDSQWLPFFGDERWGLTYLPNCLGQLGHHISNFHGQVGGTGGGNYKIQFLPRGE